MGGEFLVVGGGDWFLARDCLVGRGRAGVDWLGIIGWRFGCACGVVLVGCWHGDYFLVWSRLVRFVPAWSWCAYSAHWWCSLAVLFSSGWCGRGKWSVWGARLERVFLAVCWSDWRGLFSGGWLVCGARVFLVRVVAGWGVVGGRCFLGSVVSGAFWTWGDWSLFIGGAFSGSWRYGYFLIDYWCGLFGWWLAGGCFFRWDCWCGRFLVWAWIVGAGVLGYGFGWLARWSLWRGTISFRLTAVASVLCAGSFDNGDCLVGVLVGRVFMGA